MSACKMQREEVGELAPDRSSAAAGWHFWAKHGTDSDFGVGGIINSRPAAQQQRTREKKEWAAGLRVCVCCASGNRVQEA